MIRKAAGQWLWLSWQSGLFLYYRSAVQIQSLGKFNLNACTLSTVLKNENKEKEVGNFPFITNACLLSTVFKRQEWRKRDREWSILKRKSANPNIEMMLKRHQDDFGSGEGREPLPSSPLFNSVLISFYSWDGFRRAHISPKWIDVKWRYELKEDQRVGRQCWQWLWLSW